MLHRALREAVRLFWIISGRPHLKHAACEASKHCQERHAETADFLIDAIVERRHCADKVMLQLRMLLFSNENILPGADDGLRTGEALTQASEDWARREAKFSRFEGVDASAENRHSCHRRYAVGCAYLLILRDERGLARYQRRLHQGRPRKQRILCLGDLATD